MASEHHRTAERFGLFDDELEIVHRAGHAPVLGELDAPISAPMCSPSSVSFREVFRLVFETEFVRLCEDFFEMARSVCRREHRNPFPESGFDAAGFFHCLLSLSGGITPVETKRDHRVSVRCSPLNTSARDCSEMLERGHLLRELVGHLPRRTRWGMRATIAPAPAHVSRARDATLDTPFGLSTAGSA